MCVVNYDIPVLGGQSNNESYYHRTGRAGRFGRAGIAINLIHRQEELDAFDGIAKVFSLEPIEVAARTEEELFEFLRPFVLSEANQDEEDEDNKLPEP